MDLVLVLLALLAVVAAFALLKRRLADHCPP